MKLKIFTLWAFLFICAYPLVAQTGGTAQLKVISVCETDSIRFHVINVGDADLTKKVEYYVIEDEIIGRGYIENLEQGDSLEFIIHPKGLLVSLEVEQVGADGAKKQMVGSQVANCGSAYEPRIWDIDGKFNQKVTGKLNNPWAIGVYVGNLGTGLTVAKHINNKFTLRFGGTYLPIRMEEFISLEGANTTYDIRLASADVKLDYYVSKNPKNKFHLTFGALYNFSEFNVNAIPSEESFTFGNMVVDREEIGSIDIKITPNKFNPYLGVGVGRLARYNKKLGFKFELGGLFIGSPNVDLIATGIVEPTASQEAIIERNLRQYYIYPTMNFFMSFKL